MATTLFPKLSERVFAVRAAWRRQIPLKVRVEAVREAAGRNASVPVVDANGRPSAEPSAPSSSLSGPPVRQVRFDVSETRVA